MPFAFIPSQDATDTGRLILRDGTTAHIRPAQRSDVELLRYLFQRLSVESRYHRFFSASLPSDQMIETLCDNRDPRRQQTLLVMRTLSGRTEAVATGSYFGRDGSSAEVAFTVDDAFQGKGLGTLLLERLSLLAAQNGFVRMWAVTQTDNLAMRNMFRDSGFPMKERLNRGEYEYEISLVPDFKAVEHQEMRDRIATVASLRPFFKPHAVAVVGASRDPNQIGHRILKGLIGTGFHGKIFPVNPKASEVAGLATFPAVSAIPELVDLAVLAVPPLAILKVVDDCAARGVRALIVITAGFAEVQGGKEIQAQLLEKVRGHGMRMVGPNCLGVINADPEVRLNASFSPISPPPGRVAMSSQSGALGLAVLAATQQLHLGMSTFVSVGNKADVSGNDLLQYWEEDPKTDVILLYLESFGNPQRFARIARRVSRRKPIIAIKAGRGVAGTRAASSHTAALASKEVAVDALFRQTGVIRVDVLEEMFDVAAALAGQPLPAGNRVAIVTNAGGPGILCADACEAAGLALPELSAATQAKLAEFLPTTASLTNPVDMIASAPPELYRRTMEVVAQASEVDAVIVIYIPVGFGELTAYHEAIAQGLKAARAGNAKDKLVLGCWMSEVHLAPKDGTEHIPAYHFPEAPARVLGKIVEYAQWRRKPLGTSPDLERIDTAAVRAVCQSHVAQGAGEWLSVAEVRSVLEATGFTLPPGGIAATADEAVKFAQQIGYPVVLKLASQKIVHKTDIGGVYLNLNSAEFVRSAFLDLQSKLTALGQSDAFEGALIQPMLRGGVEVMAGVTRDPLFGPLIAFGLGGVLVEVLSDVVFRIAPLTDLDAGEMIQSLRGVRLLKGFRGQPAVDQRALETMLLRLSRLAEEVPQIAEIDFNPVLALPEGQGYQIVDARIRVVR